MGCGTSFQGFTDEQKERMFSDYASNFKIKGSDIINEKQYLIKRMIRIKQTIQVYPMLCQQRCLYPTFPQASYIPQKFNLCPDCQSTGIQLTKRRGDFPCRVCKQTEYQLIAPVPCKKCRASGLIVEKNTLI